MSEITEMNLVEITILSFLPMRLQPLADRDFPLLSHRSMCLSIPEITYLG